ncbi:MAG TPA: histidine kinase, partial [Candidatus Obscuribacterales bacterium]
FLGREFLSYIVGLVLVVVISRSARRETEYRLEAEKLSKQIETLSQDLERNRVASEIKANVDHLLVALMLNVDYINKVRFQSTELAIEGLKQARALAQESLAEVRKALAMIRDFAL